ncbi:hypothetical protein [Oscillatoria sp. FACHB-1407]|uniref:hypothetical protein n=1 Tax=Oscillatoria sp. FACHB-1407 TaxID=2692847 RepID=UPI0028155703|nr:hypothetical protein [Oscillatoria sp. FACHB-1407]
MLKARLGNRVLLRFQDPIQRNDYSEPKSDVAVVKIALLDYEDHHPTPGEVYLLIEVVDSTLKRDRSLLAAVQCEREDSLNAY